MATPTEILGSMPVGVRFKPNDEELVDHYLRSKILGKPISFQMIAEVELCRHDPWELPHFSVVKSKDREWFFFCPRKNKNWNSERRERATKAGFWKVTGQDRKIKKNGKVIGTKKTLVFQRHGGPKAKADWVIHEYHTEEFPLDERKFVVCRLMDKTENHGKALVNDEGQPSNHAASEDENQASVDRIPDLCFSPEKENLDSIFQGMPQAVDQETSFPNSSLPSTIPGSETSKEDDNFVNSLLAVGYDHDSDDEGQSSNHAASEDENHASVDRIPDLCFSPENVNLDSIFQGMPQAVDQETSFPNSSLPSTIPGSETSKEDDNFVNSLLAVGYDHDSDERQHRQHAFTSDELSIKSAVEHDLSSFQQSSFFTEQETSFQNSSLPSTIFGNETTKEDDDFGNSLLAVRDDHESEERQHAFTSDEHSPPMRLIPKSTVARRRQLHRKASRKEKSKDKDQKEAATVESRKDQRKAQGSSSEKNLETRLLSQNPMPRSMYLLNVVVGLCLLIVTIWGLISSAKCY